MSYAIWLAGLLDTALHDVARERYRQEELRRKGKFAWTCADPKQTSARKLAVLAEEFGELAREVTEEIIFHDKLIREPIPSAAIEVGFRKKMRAELVQIAAVAVAWVESLDDEASE